MPFTITAVAPARKACWTSVGESEGEKGARWIGDQSRSEFGFYSTISCTVDIWLKTDQSWIIKIEKKLGHSFPTLNHQRLECIRQYLTWSTLSNVQSPTTRTPTYVLYDAPIDNGTHLDSEYSDKQIEVGKISRKLVRNHAAKSEFGSPRSSLGNCRSLDIQWYHTFKHNQSCSINEQSQGHVGTRALMISRPGGLSKGETCPGSPVLDALNGRSAVWELLKIGKLCRCSRPRSLCYLC